MIALLLKLHGWLRLAVWAAGLYLLLDLWSRLGGTVSETVRWWARLGLGAGAIVGWSAGTRARELAGWGSGRSHAALLRWFWTPPALLTAVLIVAMTLAGQHDEARATFGTLFAYCACFDAAIAGWPLASGRPYRFLREIPPEEPRDDEPLGDDDRMI